MGEDLKKFYRAFCEVIFGADITPNNVVVKVHLCQTLLSSTVGHRAFVRHNTAGSSRRVSRLADC